MTPREWTGCVVGVRSLAAAGCVGTHSGCVTIRRAWRGARTGRLRRVALRHLGRRRVLAW